MPGSTMPLPTVAATFRWNTKMATTLKKAAKATAWVGLRTPVDTTVAIELAASRKPFMKSNSSASTTSTTTTTTTHSAMLGVMLGAMLSVICKLCLCRPAQEFSSRMPSTRLATSSH